MRAAGASAFPRGLAAVSCLVVAGCSSSKPPAPPVTTTLGDFTLSSYPDSARLTVAGPDGALLLDGLDASGDTGTPANGNDDAPPMTGFAVRDVSTKYAMAFGSFEISDAPNAPWRVATGARWPSTAGPLSLVDQGGAVLASLTFTVPDDPGHLVVDVAPGAGPERRFSWGFRCTTDDHFLGFGSQTWGADARGETLPIWLQEEGVHKDLTTDDATGAWFLVGRRHSAYMPLPEFLSSRGYMAVAETNALATFSMCGERDDTARMQLEMPVRVHLFYGPAPADAIGRMTALFGRPRVPPAFAFAPWNDAIFGSANVRRVANELRANGVPSSVIWTEDWRGGAFSTNFPGHYALNEEWEVDRTLYPDFEAVAKDLHAAGFKWLVYFNSFVEKQSKAWPETAPQGYLIQGSDGQPYVFSDAKFNDASMVDLSNPQAAAWAAGKMAAAIALGADGWMGDYSEWLPTDARCAGGSGLDLHAQYPLEWQRAQRKALDGVGDGVERLSFVRSGWLGTPPLADVWWAGDQQTDWGVDDGLPTVVPIALGVSLAGVSTFGSDIAGYQNLNSPPSDKELFFRWTELGAFSPVMRTHHGSAPKTNWAFDSDADTLSHWARYAKLHIALAPYFRALAQRAHDTGLAIMRPLAVDYPADPALWPVADEFMLGAELLVAPVLAQGQTSRAVTLPQDGWYPWLGGPAVVVAAGQSMQVSAAVTEIPVFARKGAIVPAYPDGVQTLTVEPSNVENAAGVGGDRIVYVFSGASGSFAEVAGPSYQLTSNGDVGPDPADASWNGQPLATCAQTPAPPCVQVGGDGFRAFVVGAGTLTLARAGAPLLTFAVQTPVAAAREQIVVRR